MAETSSQKIVKKFAENFNKKFTGVMFKKELGVANSLLKAGFTEDDLILTLDYLKLHPPVRGINSLAYLQYIINDILPKAKVMKMQEVQQFFESSDMPSTEDNKEKYNASERPVIKGTKNIFGGE